MIEPSKGPEPAPEPSVRAGTPRRPHHPGANPSPARNLLAGFTGTTTPYGRIAKAQDSYTHRLGWKLLRGPIPEGKELHHRCGVYACWNPDHLQLVTHAENLAYVRKTECKHGHPLSGPNLRIDPRTGARACRACLRENQRRYRIAAAASRTSDPSPPRGPGRPGRTTIDRRRSDIERLLDDTVLSRPDPELGTCWVFTGPANPYGRVDRQSERYAHRLGWKLLRGPIPDGMELHHRCGVPACWNPATCSCYPRENWRTGARRTASVGIRCQVPTYGSTHARARGSADRAAPKISERFASAKPQPSSSDSQPHSDTPERSLVRFHASPITSVMLTGSAPPPSGGLVSCPCSPKLPLLSEAANRSATAQRSCHLWCLR